MSSASADSNKRRRISTSPEQSGTREEAEVVPPEIMSSFGPPAGGGVELVQPVLGEIPQLLFVEMQKENPDDVANAMIQLWNRMRTSEEKRKAAIKSGAHFLVPMTMRKWQQHEGVQRDGTFCLCTIACASEDVLLLMFESGGMEAFVNSIRSFPSSEDVVGHGLSAIRNWLCQSDVTRKVIGRRFVEDLNGIRLVLDAMSKFEDVSFLLQDCCMIFHELAKQKELRKPMIEAGVLSAVAGTIEKHLEDPLVKKAAGLFMKKMYS